MEVIAAAIAQLETDNYKKALDKNLYQAVMTEAAQLKPVLAVLDGKKHESYGKVAGAMVKRKRVAAVNPANVEAAATAFSNWLARPDSKLRGVLALLGCGGVFWAAQAAEKSARAWKEHAPADEHIIVEVAKARLCSEAPEEEQGAVDDTAGLFA